MSFAHRLITAVAGFALASVYAAPLDEANRKLSRDIFQQLIEINTTDSSGNITIASQAMAKRFLDAGFASSDVHIVGPTANTQNLVVRMRGAGGSVRKPILIICHLDVVEARRADWTSDPFQFAEKDGYFYGRGTQDMKNNDAALVTDFIRLRKEGWQPDRDLILALTSGEESGKLNGVDWRLKNHRDLVDAEFVLNPDSGGVTSMNGKIVNVDIEASEKLYADFEFSTTNPGGHSSLPTPDNAIYHLSESLSRLAKYHFPVELNPITRTYFERRAPLENSQMKTDMNGVLHNPPDEASVAHLSKDPRYNSILRTTCVATRLNGGHANNALPQLAQATVNCRILPGHSAEEIRQELVRIAGDPKITVRYIAPNGDVADRAPNDKAFAPVMPKPEILQPLERLAKEMWPGAPVIPDMETGASDSVYTVAVGIPSYGVSGMAIDQDDVRAHGRDERIRASSFYDGVEFYYRYLRALAGR